MKKIFLMLAMLVLSFHVMAQQGPKIEFQAKDNTIDYGKISKGDDSGVREFEFYNSGDAPLQIISVLSTRECAIVSKPTSSILPGKSAKIIVKYNMSTGPIRKTITVETNAVNYPEGRIALKIKGEVIN
jgi:hypothetical protein